MDISSVLSAKQVERGISFAELARRCFINEDMVSRIMKGKSMPKGDQLIRLCKELNLEVSDFTGDTDAA